MLKNIIFGRYFDFLKVSLIVALVVGLGACSGKGAEVLSPADVPNEMPKMQDDHSVIRKMMEDARESAIAAEEKLGNAQ